MIASCPASAPLAIGNGKDALLRVRLEQWELAVAEEPCDPDRVHALRFRPARVPGTVASALGPANRSGLDMGEYWFCCEFAAEPPRPGEEVLLELGGIATISETWLNGRHILSSESMFASHRIDVSAILREQNELLIVCRPLSAAIRARRGRPPAARWRTRVVAEQQLRWFRTTLLGRAPGFAPDPAPVGPWRPVSLLRRRHIALEKWSREVVLDGDAGIVRASFEIRALQSDLRPGAGWLHCGDWSAPIDLDAQRAELRIPGARRWFPHTHGDPELYPVSLELRLGDSTHFFEDAPAGFRSIRFERGELRVNGVAVFCRGAVWTPADPVGFEETSLRERLVLLRDGGFNLIRVPGTMTYESETFHRACDELGLLVWQDLMFANMDYPFADPDFWETARGEAESQLSRISRHASTAFICGNSEIEQQVGMLGLDASLGRGPFFGEELPRIAARRCPGIPYIPSAPSGGDLPFRTHTGVANYFGVGAYLRPLEDARRAAAPFASECLALANVPEPELIEKMALAHPGGISPVHPAWKRGVSRDAGVGWDFEDVRDHYLKLLYGVDPAALRYADLHRYWELSRMVSAELMAEVFGEWRRAGSGCGGGIILWAADLEPGAGWGILDSEGRPKAPYWFLKRALAPCAIWTTDEGLNGIDIHIANDRPQPLQARLRVALYRNGEQKMEEAGRDIEIAARGVVRVGVEEILGKFIDASYAYRFGPPGHDLIAASLHRERGDVPFAQTFRCPAGRAAHRAPIAELGISGQARPAGDGSIELLLRSRKFAQGVRVSAAKITASDCYFGLEPGVARRITLWPASGAAPRSLTITAVNAEGRLTIQGVE
jgi:beta-mannosidase